MQYRYFYSTEQGKSSAHRLCPWLPDSWSSFPFQKLKDSKLMALKLLRLKPLINNKGTEMTKGLDKRL